MYFCFFLLQQQILFLLITKTKKMKQLVKEVLLKLLLSTAIFAVVVLFLYLCGLFNYKPIEKLGMTFSEEFQFALQIVSGIIGTAYVLVVKNPSNYLGFPLGIIMSLMLAFQFFIQGFPDETILYVCVFVPCQIYTLITWIKGSKKSEQEPFMPTFLSMKVFLTGIAIFVVLIFADIFLLQNKVMGNDINFPLVMSAIVVAASTLANFLLIKKKTDAWFYWVLFSVAGAVQLLYIGEWVSATLFVLYIFINGSACVAWCKQTAKENRGWLLGK